MRESHAFRVGRAWGPLGLRRVAGSRGASLLSDRSETALAPVPPRGGPLAAGCHFQQPGSESVLGLAPAPAGGGPPGAGPPLHSSGAGWARRPRPGPQHSLARKSVSGTGTHGRTRLGQSGEPGQRRRPSGVEAVAPTAPATPKLHCSCSRNKKITSRLRASEQSLGPASRPDNPAGRRADAPERRGETPPAGGRFGSGIRAGAGLAQSPSVPLRAHTPGEPGV